MPACKRLRSSRSLFLVSSLVLLTAPVVLTWREWRQETLNRALIAAIKANAPQAVVHLLEEGADANTHDTPGDMPAFWQILYSGQFRRRSEQTDTALVVTLDQHFNPAYGGDSWIPPRDVRILESLLHKGADSNVVTQNGRTPLILATMNAPEDFIRVLLAYNAELETKDRDGKTALMWAAGYREATIVRMLLEHGADANAHTSEGETALFFVLRDKNADTVTLLLQHHAKVNVVDNQGATPI